MKISEVITDQIKGLWGTDLEDNQVGIPVIKTNNMTYEGIIDYSSLTFRNIPVEDAKKSYLSNGDLLVEKSGGTKTHTVGYVNYFNGESDTYVCNNFILALRPNKSLVDCKYLFYQLKFMYENGYFSDCYNRTTGIQNLQVKTYLNKDIKVANLDEQASIVKELDRITDMISLKRANLLQLNELVKSRFIEMFGDIDLSPQLKEWKPLSELGTIYTGTTPSTADESNWDGNVLWITPAEMDENSFLVSDTVRKITDKGQKSKSLTLMPIGTVLLSTRAPIGKVGIVNKPMTCNQGFKNFYCPDTLNSIYLYVLLKNNTAYLNSIGTGTTFKEISKSTCGKIRIPVPEITRQNEFAEFVKLIDKSKFIVQKQIKDLQELLDCKMDEYFG